jgi:hypothetical protein
MTFNEEQVEWIVGEVIRRLGLLEGRRGTATSVSSPVTELVVAEKVVTMRTIQDRLTNVSKIVVSDRAVVTPAVRDELRSRKIELIRR